jgi:hypothetical protein
MFSSAGILVLFFIVGFSRFFIHDKKILLFFALYSPTILHCTHLKHMFNTHLDRQVNFQLRNQDSPSTPISHLNTHLNTQLNTHIELIDCKYYNADEYIQIVRLSEPAWAYLEKVVMPKQAIYFRAPFDSALEVYEAALVSSIHLDTIPCSQLRLTNLKTVATVATELTDHSVYGNVA